MSYGIGNAHTLYVNSKFPWICCRLNLRVIIFGVLHSFAAENAFVGSTATIQVLDTSCSHSVLLWPEGCACVPQENVFSSCIETNCRTNYNVTIHSNSTSKFVVFHINRNIEPFLVHLVCDEPGPSSSSVSTLLSTHRIVVKGTCRIINVATYINTQYSYV